MVLIANSQCAWKTVRVREILLTFSKYQTIVNLTFSEELMGIHVQVQQFLCYYRCVEFYQSTDFCWFLKINQYNFIFGWIKSKTKFKSSESTFFWYILSNLSKFKIWSRTYFSYNCFSGTYRWNEKHEVEIKL